MISVRSSWWLALIFTLISSSVNADLKPLITEQYKHIRDNYQGRDHVVMFWSVDCPPCHKELEYLGELAKKKHPLPLLLISTDKDLAAEKVSSVLRSYGLEQLNNWQFADPVSERLRYAIDPQWYGELPRAYFYKATGERSAHSGLLPKALLREWLGIQQ